MTGDDFLETQAHCEAGDDETVDEATQKEFGVWWAQLPDFIKPDYPLDIPPERMPFVREVFTTVGAPRLCAVAACRRAEACQGGDGPPCFRADRKDLSRVLFLWWMMTFADFPFDEFEATLTRAGNRYAVQPPKPERTKWKRRR